MDEAAKKIALRMIPYGFYVLTTVSKDGKDVGAATVNWITQSSFSPKLVVAGVKADSGAHQHIKDTGTFAVNVLGKDQIDRAFNFFKSHERDGNSIGGQAFEPGPVTGSPPAHRMPSLVGVPGRGEVSHGDPTVFVGEVLEAGVRAEDQAILMRNHNLNYGG